MKNFNKETFEAVKKADDELRKAPLTDLIFLAAMMIDMEAEDAQLDMLYTHLERKLWERRVELSLIGQMSLKNKKQEGYDA